MTAITRHFAYTRRGRRVHYRRAGSGPPLVLLHASPSSSRVQVPLIEAWAHRFTVIALDTPGFGLSEPLPGADVEIADLAEALAETLDALDLGRVLLYGRHTGGSIAVEFARRHPQRAAFVLTDGYTITPQLPSATYLEAYLPPIVPRWDGGHLLWLWHRYREQFVFWPWNNPAGERADTDLPALADLQRGVVEFLEAGSGYASVYAAALRYRWDEPLRHLTTPVCFGVRPGDSQFRKADYLRTAGIEVEVLPRAAKEAARHELAILEKHAAGLRSAPAAPSGPPGAMDYVDIGGSQILLRRNDGKSGLPLVMLPPLPGGSDQVVPLMHALESSRPIIALDPPGNGYSDAIAGAACVPTWADAISTALDRLGIDRAALYGRHGGAALAAELAQASPGRFASIVLDAPTTVPAPQRDALAARYCPQLTPRWDGSHLVSLWHFVRDQRLWWPWFSHDRAGIHPSRPDIDVESLHREASLLALNIESVAPSWESVLRYPLAERLRSLPQPLMIGADANDSFAPCLEVARACRPDAVQGAFGAGKHAAIRAFLRGL